MIICVLLTSGCGSTTPSAPPLPSPSATAEEAEHRDEGRLQGYWGAVTYIENGQGQDQEPIAPEDSAIKFAFEQSKFTLLPSGWAGELPQGTFKLGSDDGTKTIDLIFRDKPDAVLGIYEIEGDTLKLCYAPNGVQRPNEFKADAGSKRTTMILKRITDLSQILQE